MPKVSRDSRVIGDNYLKSEQREPAIRKFVEDPPNKLSASTRDLEQLGKLIPSYPLNSSPPAGKKPAAEAVDTDQMDDILQVRRSDRVASQAEAKAAKAASELATKEWEKEIKQVAKQVANDRTQIRKKIRTMFGNATYDELVFDSEKAKNANERFAFFALEELIAEKVAEAMEEEEEETEEIRSLRKFIEDAPVEERDTDKVKDAIKQLALKTGIVYKFTNGNDGAQDQTREKTVADAIRNKEPVPPLTDADKQRHYETYGKWNGGRRRKTKKNKKSRRKTKRGGSEKPPPAQQPNPPDVEEPPNKRPKHNPPPAPPAPPAAPVEQPDVEMGGRRKTKRSRRTTRR